MKANINPRIRSIVYKVVYNLVSFILIATGVISCILSGLFTTMSLNYDPNVVVLNEPTYDELRQYSFDYLMAALCVILISWLLGRHKRGFFITITLLILSLPMAQAQECYSFSKKHRNTVVYGTNLYVSTEIGLRTIFTEESLQNMYVKGIEPGFGICHRWPNHQTQIQIGFNDGDFGGELRYNAYLPIGNFGIVPGILYRNGKRWNDNDIGHRTGRLGVFTGLMYIDKYFEFEMLVRYNIIGGEFYPSMKFTVPVFYEKNKNW